jgi:hypothetical protein
LQDRIVALLDKRDQVGLRSAFLHAQGEIVGERP